MNIFLIVLKEKCKLLDKDGFNGILMADLSNVFNHIDRTLLIAKMYAYGFDITEDENKLIFQ